MDCLSFLLNIKPFKSILDMYGEYYEKLTSFFNCQKNKFIQ